MRVDSDGNLGIGTDAPGAFNLAVNGPIAAKVGIKVLPNLTDPFPTVWPDYVFKEGYHLKPLEEVEAFIKTNKHLPEVPSEREVAQEGVELVSMDAVLLKKIEELTLYAIEQNKRIEHQQQEIMDQRQEVKKQQQENKKWQQEIKDLKTLLNKLMK